MNTQVLPEKKNRTGISSFALHIIAMVLMLCDHLWGTIVPGNDWLTLIGRIAYPIFAFMIVEGYFHTRSFKKYLLRLFLFALLSEIPFNLMHETSFFAPLNQNVLWTFILALLCMKLLDKIRAKMKLWFSIPLCALVILLFTLLGMFTFVDYMHYGIWMILVFYFFRGNKWYHYAGQLVGIGYINLFAMKGLVFPTEIFGHVFEIPQQGAAVLALILIWCYRGKRGYHNTVTKYAFYAFYPIHMLILGLIAKFM